MANRTVGAPGSKPKPNRAQGVKTRNIENGKEYKNSLPKRGSSTVRSTNASTSVYKAGPAGSTQRTRTPRNGGATENYVYYAPKRGSMGGSSMKSSGKKK